MKTPIIILALLLGLSTTSCLQDEDLTTPDDSISTPQTTAGTSWRITYFWDSDHEETDHFFGYSFKFDSGGVITATNGLNTYSGTWSEGTDDSTPKLYLTFVSPSDFEELSDDWHILEWSETKIRLQDVSGGNGGTDLLTFEMI